VGIKIGRRGLGFRPIYNIRDTPCILSRRSVWAFSRPLARRYHANQLATKKTGLLQQKRPRTGSGEEWARSEPRRPARAKSSRCRSNLRTSRKPPLLQLAASAAVRDGLRATSKPLRISSAAVARGLGQQLWTFRKDGKCRNGDRCPLAAPAAEKRIRERRGAWVLVVVLVRPRRGGGRKKKTGPDFKKSARQSFRPMAPEWCGGLLARCLCAPA
jgi:hypothetical protein